MAKAYTSRPAGGPIFEQAREIHVPKRISSTRQDDTEDSISFCCTRDLDMTRHYPLGPIGVSVTLMAHWLLSVGFSSSFFGSKFICGPGLVFFVIILYIKRRNCQGEHKAYHHTKIHGTLCEAMNRRITGRLIYIIQIFNFCLHTKCCTSTAYI